MAPICMFRTSGFKTGTGYGVYIYELREEKKRMLILYEKGILVLIRSKGVITKVLRENGEKVNKEG